MRELSDEEVKQVIKQNERIKKLKSIREEAFNIYKDLRNMGKTEAESFMIVISNYLK